MTFLNKKLDTNANLTKKYVDENTLEEIAEPSYYTNLKFGDYAYYPIFISGYNLLGDFPVKVSLNENDETKVITFKYRKNIGSVTIKYIDKDTSEPLVEDTIYSNVKVGNYNYYPIQIDGYSLIDLSEKTVVLDEDNLNKVILFKYKKL